MGSWQYVSHLLYRQKEKEENRLTRSDPFAVKKSLMNNRLPGKMRFYPKRAPRRRRILTTKERGGT